MLGNIDKIFLFCISALAVHFESQVRFTRFYKCFDMIFLQIHCTGNKHLVVDCVQKNMYIRNNNSSLHVLILFFKNTSQIFKLI